MLNTPGGWPRRRSSLGLETSIWHRKRKCLVVERQHLMNFVKTIIIKNLGASKSPDP